MDKVSRQVRSKVMAAIRGRGNKSTELKLLSLLRKHGITGWRRHLPLPGRPDFAFRESKVAVFVDGCFWHKCPRCFRPPKSSQDYWEAKIARNTKRDAEMTAQLKGKGWKVLRIWECRLKAPCAFLRRLSRLLGKPASMRRSPAPGRSG